MTLFNDGISREPIKHKAEMLRTIVENADLVIVAAYGSSKDMPGYQSIHVPADRIFLVGKGKHRHQGHARFLADGYALHLSKRERKITTTTTFAYQSLIDFCFQRNYLNLEWFDHRNPILVI